MTTHLFGLESLTASHFPVYGGYESVALVAAVPAREARANEEATALTGETTTKIDPAAGTSGTAVATLVALAVLSGGLAQNAEAGTLQSRSHFLDLMQNTASAVVAPTERSVLDSREPELAAWIRQVGEQPPSVAALELHRRMNAELREKRFEKISEALAAVDVADVTTLALVGVLRSTFAARTRIPEWRNFARRVRKALEQRGENADVLLRGLGGYA
ncbi:MAG: hypothetical protein ACQEXJ_21435 [Myxococcota bacterium]